MNITAHIGGRSVPRADVLAWEMRRATTVAKKLGITVPSGDVVAARRALVVRKLELGHDGIERLLAAELRWSESVGRVGVALSAGRRRLCSIGLTGNAGSSEIVPRFYQDAIASNDEAPLLSACPDHYVLRTRADGRQEVIETTGGAPLAVRMFFDSTDLSTLTSVPEPGFRTEWAGVARGADGTPIGGIRHQFQDGDFGFRARLTVEFPLATPGFMIRAHQWHLACEFSNWIEAANRA